MTTQEEYDMDKRQLALARSVLLSERSNTIRAREKEKNKIIKEYEEEQYTGLKSYMDPYIFNLLQNRARENAMNKLKKLSTTEENEEDEYLKELV